MSDTKFVFVNGQAFVLAAKHEQTVGRIIAERDHLRRTLRDLLLAAGRRDDRGAQDTIHAALDWEPDHEEEAA